MILLPAVIALTAIRAKMYKKKISLVIAIIVFMVITVNLPQIYSEIKTGGANSREFIKGIGVKTGQNKNFGEKTLRVSECFLKNNYYVFSALGGNDGCTFFKKSKTTSLLEFYVRLIFSIIFLVGGVFIGLRNWQNEKEPGKRAYLEMMMFMAFVAFFLFLPFAKYVSMRYFMVILFWPFLLAGFWLKKIVDSSQKSKYFITGFLIVAFIGLNIRTYWQTFSAK
jgi:hypothetical protein